MPRLRSLAQHRSILYRWSLPLGLLALALHLPAQQIPQPVLPAAQLPNSPGSQLPATITGTVADRDNATIAAARITLIRQNSAPPEVHSTTSAADGTFTFTNLTPGTFQLTILANGFAPQQTIVTLHPGESFSLPQLALAASSSIEVQAISQREEAEQQIHAEEQQRVLGFIPNFYVSYASRPVPLAPRQKFELAWHNLYDPTTFIFTGVIAGIEQSQNIYSGYGSGASGYAKRYAASYGDFLTATLIGNAILPSLLKQDPRYFYKGTGSTRSRIGYALANAVICKGDNGRWQANYSGILGSLASGGISNLYYPAADRQGFSLTIENTLLSIGASGVSNLFQEFLVRRLTPHLPPPAPAKP